ncbi:MAG: T9SS type A sorting domain-containing protein [bacterium]|nr:T9SS type A sorting domain-containing protein [bacterium]
MRNVPRIGSLLLLSISLILLSSIICVAETYFVPTDFSAIQPALDFAESGDTILVAPGTYFGHDNNNLHFDGKDLVLIGSGGAEATTIAVTYDTGSTGFNCFRFGNSETSDCLVRGFTLINEHFFSFGGAIKCLNGSSPRFEDLIVEDIAWTFNPRYCRGACLYCEGASNPSFTNVLFQNNHSGDGGVIYIASSAPTFTDVIFRGNRALYGEEFGGSRDDGKGGVVLIEGGAPTFRSCLFENNEALLGGVIAGEGHPVFEDCEFSANRAHVGGVAACDFSLSFDNCSFKDNEACSFSSDVNTSPGIGGVLYLDDASANFSHCLFQRNIARAPTEGAIMPQGAGKGGVAFCSIGITSFTSCTFHGNATEPWEDEESGVLHLSDGSTTTLTRNIMTNSLGGWVIWAEPGSLPAISCCDLWNTDMPIIGGVGAEVIGFNGNISIDPLYCDVENGDFTLNPVSHCLPGANDCDVTMGAFGEGCDAIPAYTISGHIGLEDGSPLANHLLHWDGGFTVATDAGGNYSISLYSGWSGSISPILCAHDAEPQIRSYENLQTDQFGQDFVMTPISPPFRVPEDMPTIQRALDCAVSGDTILVAPGVYSGSENINLDFGGKDLVLIGTGGAEATTIWATSESGHVGTKCFDFDSGESTACLVRGFTLRNDRFYSFGGAIVCSNASSPRFEDLIIDGIEWNTASRFCLGAGLYCTELSSPSFTNVVFSNNHSGTGGAVYVVSGQPTFVNVTFRGNQALQDDHPGDPVVEGSGGAVYNEVGTVTFSSCLFEGNEAVQGGACTDIGASTYDGCEFTRNSANRGGVVSSQGISTFINCSFTANEAQRLATQTGEAPGLGGVAWLENATTVFRGCLLLGNIARTHEEGAEYPAGAGLGGAAFCSGGTVEFESCTIHETISEPWLAESGGALHFSDGTAASLIDCVMTRSEGGCAIWSDDEDLAIICCDLWNDDRPLFGGACPDVILAEGNISIDPLYCDVDNGDFTLSAASRCLPAVNGCGELMGAFTQGCDEVATHTISGRVALSDGSPLAGLVFSCDGGFQVTTDAEGNYSIVIHEGWSGAIAPYILGYETSPPQRDYVELVSDHVEQNFVLTRGLQPYHVPADFPNIQDALDFALEGDTILVAPGTYGGERNHELDFNGKGMTLIGTGGSAVTTLVLEVCPYPMHEEVANIRFDDGEGPDCLVRGFTLDHNISCRNRKAIVVTDESSPSFDDIVIEGLDNNIDYDCCGPVAIRTWEDSSPRFTNSIIRDNESGNAVVSIGSGTPVFENVLFENNVGSENGYGSAVFVWGTATPVFIDCHFENNRGNYGGAIHDRGSATYLNCRFENNVARRDRYQYTWWPGLGGGVYLRSSTSTFTDCIFRGNVAESSPTSIAGIGKPGRGGAVYARYGGPSFEQCTFHDNVAEAHADTLGGALQFGGGTNAFVDACIISGATEGCAILVEEVEDVLTVTCSNFFITETTLFHGECPDLLQVGGNVSVDPLYCMYAEDDFTLAAASPCLPGGNACGVRMGAYDQGCVDVPVLLSGFSAESESSAVVLSWTTSEVFAAPEFILEAVRDDVTRTVAWSEDAPRSFMARDELATQEPGEIVYRLLGRLVGEEWLPLGMLSVMPAVAPLNTALLAPFPNPFNPQVNIEFTLGAVGAVRVSIYDVSGRLVRRLADGQFANGRHELIWEGRDDQGRDQSSGVYFVQMETAGATERQRLVLLR